MAACTLGELAKRTIGQTNSETEREYYFSGICSLRYFALSVYAAYDGRDFQSLEVSRGETTSIERYPNSFYHSCNRTTVNKQ